MISPPLAPDLDDTLARGIAEIQRLADATREGDRDAAAELATRSARVPGLDIIVRRVVNGMTLSRMQAKIALTDARREEIQKRQKAVALKYLDYEARCIKWNRKPNKTTFAKPLCREFCKSINTIRDDIDAGMLLLKERTPAAGRIGD